MRSPFTALVVAVMLTLASAATALADTSDSTNWAGYAVHRPGVSFRSVSAMWREPTATCTPGSQRYSAVWVGLGGYSQTSNALEQIGTEIDCGPSGNVIPSAWYELVPKPAQPVAFRVRPGDLLVASVTVNGWQVVETLTNDTLHRTFSKTLRTSMLDVSSAEWIVEAPSNCIGAYNCVTLPLADFGSATFDHAAAESTTGHSGSISDRAWSSTKIVLRPRGRRFVVDGQAASSVGGATPSALTAKGASFKVSYSALSAQGDLFLSDQALRAGEIVHLGR